VNLDENVGGPMVETEFLWIKVSRKSSSMKIDLNSMKERVAIMNISLASGFFDSFVIYMRKFGNGMLDPPEDACWFRKRPFMKDGVIFRYIKSAAANAGEKTKLDLRIRIYEREVYVHQNGKLLIVCVAPETHRFVVMSEYESMVHRIEAEFVSATPYRVSIEQTLYPLPYYEEFNDYGFRDGDIIHFNGFFRRSFRVMFVTNDNFHTSRYLDFLLDKNDELSVTYVDPTDTNYPQSVAAGSHLKFRDIDWRDVFIERKNHELLVSFGDHEVCSETLHTAISNVYWDGECTAVRILGSLGVLQYYRSTRDKNSEYIKEYMRIVFNETHSSSIRDEF
uniref:Galectin n=1 Tax=Parascaris univalens TaxID=6257 RepID=A0A915C6W9_PARUN